MKLLGSRSLHSLCKPILKRV